MRNEEIFKVPSILIKTGLRALFGIMVKRDR